MTDRHPTLTTVRLQLYVGVHSTAWSVVYRTSTGREVFDRRVSAGSFPGTRPLLSPNAVCDALEAALAEMRARYGLAPAAGGPGAPGGGGGRLDQVTPGDPSTVPLSIVRDTR